MICDTHWQGIPDNYQEHAGFVYKIVNCLTGKAYIGRKYFYKRLKRALVESDWKTYTSSSADVNTDIKKHGIENFAFYVLYLSKDRRDINYVEVFLQMQADVLNAVDSLGQFLFYNKNIMSKYFQPKDAGTPEHVAKCANIKKAIIALYNDPLYIHPMKGKQHPNKGKKLPQTAPKNPSCQGAMWYTNGNLNLIVKGGDKIPEGFVRGQTKRVAYVSKAMHLRREIYKNSPKFCLFCKKELPFAKRTRKCCDSKCQNKLQSTKLKGTIPKVPKKTKKGLV